MKKLLFSVCAFFLIMGCGGDNDEMYGLPCLSCGKSPGSGYTGYYGSVYYEGQSYKTVVIGNQTWFAENLNYAVGGSECYRNSNSSCNTYGRLYNWSTAMNLPSSCNENSCSNQIQSKHRGICPPGWHIPSDDDWDVLMDYVGGSSVAGTKLKATSGWQDGGYGTDQYGFSALPGGLGLSGGSFSDVGYDGAWWSANENETFSDNAYYRGMNYDYDDASWGNYGKSILFSVRCVQD